MSFPVKKKRLSGTSGSRRFSSKLSKKYPLPYLVASFATNVVADGRTWEKMTEENVVLRALVWPSTIFESNVARFLLSANVVYVEIVEGTIIVQSTVGKIIRTGVPTTVVPYSVLFYSTALRVFSVPPNTQ